MKLTRRRLLKLGASAAVIAGLAPVAHPLSHLARTALTDGDTRAPLPAGYVDDASRMNQTPVAVRWDAPAALDACEQSLRALLAQATAAACPLAAGGTRHTMGGQSIIAQGIAANNRVYPDLFAYRIGTAQSVCCAFSVVPAIARLKAFGDTDKTKRDRL